MDEATSHLDIHCEQAVNHAIQTLKLTRIIVAHRPETIASADRVIRLVAGRVVDDTAVPAVADCCSKLRLDEFEKNILD